ncbi:DUF2796 domain-containing protein [Thiomicrorhabdus hydrogeniphila]
MTSKRILRTALFSSACLMSVDAFAETHAAHEHGVAQMNLVQIESNVVLEVTSPAFNVFGFEHKPHTEQEKALVKTRLKTMNSGGLVLFDTDANCELKETKLKNPFADDHHDHEDHDHEGHYNHRDIHVEYTFTCKNPQAVSQINLQPLFKNWPQLEQVRTQWVIGNLQSSATATRQQAQVKLK